METLTGQALAAALQKPFEMEDIEWKIQTCGLKKDGNAWAKVAPYVGAHAIRDRLDQIVGPENWKPEKFEPGAAGGLQSGLSIRINGEWITKWDGAENMGDRAGTAIKGGMSDAFKRTARVWGIGRYLARVKLQWAIICGQNDGGEYATGTDKKSKKEFGFYWKSPGLPAFCWPNGGRITAPKNGSDGNGNNENGNGTPPEDLEDLSFHELAKLTKEIARHPCRESEEQKTIANTIARIQEDMKKVQRRRIRIFDENDKPKSAYVHLNKKLWAAGSDWQQLHELECEISNMLAGYGENATCSEAYEKAYCGSN